MDRDRIYVMGVGFDPLTASAAADEISAALRSERDLPVSVVTPNPVMLMTAGADPEFRSVLNSADFVLCDGTGVIGAAKRQGTPLPERVAGIDTGMRVISAAAAGGQSVYIFGGKPGRAEKAGEKLKQSIPGLVIAGTSDGFTENTDGLPERITAAGTDLLIVCLGTPKQEKWINGNLDRLRGVKAVMALGGAVDVWSGNVRRAPSVFIKLRIEWLWRMAVSPSKLKLLPELIKFRIMTRKKENRPRFNKNT